MPPSFPWASAGGGTWNGLATGAGMGPWSGPVVDSPALAGTDGYNWPKPPSVPPNATDFGGGTWVLRNPDGSYTIYYWNGAVADVPKGGGGQVLRPGPPKPGHEVDPNGPFRGISQETEDLLGLTNVALENAVLDAMDDALLALKNGLITQEEYNAIMAQLRNDIIPEFPRPNRPLINKPPSKPPVKPTVPEEPHLRPTIRPGEGLIGAIGGAFLKGVFDWLLINDVMQEFKNCDEVKDSMVNAASSMQVEMVNETGLIDRAMQDAKNTMYDPNVPPECRSTVAGIADQLEDLLRQLADLKSQLRALQNDIYNDWCTLSFGNLPAVTGWQERFQDYYNRGQAIADALQALHQQFLELLQQLQDAKNGKCPPRPAGRPCRPGQVVRIGTIPSGPFAGQPLYGMCKSNRSSLPGRPGRVVY